MIGLCVRVGWPLAPGCYEEHWHCLCGERHGLDEVRTPKVVHTPSSQGSGHCCSPRSTNALLPRDPTQVVSARHGHTSMAFSHTALAFSFRRFHLFGDLVLMPRMGILFQRFHLYGDMASMPRMGILLERFRLFDDRMLMAQGHLDRKRLYHFRPVCQQECVPAAVNHFAYPVEVIYSSGNTHLPLVTWSAETDHASLLKALLTPCSRCRQRPTAALSPHKCGS